MRALISSLLDSLSGDVAVAKRAATLGGTGGLVKEINLRTTVLRGLDGTVHVFPNGATRIKTMPARPGLSTRARYRGAPGTRRRRTDSCMSNIVQEFFKKSR